MTTKSCTGCRVEKDIEEFSVNKNRGKYRRCSRCKDCQRASVRKSARKRAERANIVIPKEKSCNRCQKTLSCENFYSNKYRPDGLYSKCKECCRYKHRNQEVIKERSRKRQQIIWDKRDELGGKCMKCGESDPNVLELDHIHCNDKNFDINPNANLEKLKEELNKVQILCTYCHRIKSFYDMKVKLSKPDCDILAPYEKEKRLRNKEYVNKRKLEIGGCQICSRVIDLDEPASFSAFDFDHLDRKTKVASVSRLSAGGRSILKIEEEIAKCRLLCAPCHKKHSREQLGEIIHSIE
jgi:hypothetical protein